MARLMPSVQSIRYTTRYQLRKGRGVGAAWSGRWEEGGSHPVRLERWPHGRGSGRWVGAVDPRQGAAHRRV